MSGIGDTEADELRRLMFDAAMQFALEDGWREASLYAIARRANISLAEAGSVARDATGLLEQMILYADDAAAGTPIEGEHARDRLFDAVMARFDALAPWREGLAAIYRDIRLDPVAAARIGPALLRSCARTLESAGVKARGLAGVARVKRLALIRRAATRIWFDDDAAQTRTMAALDRRLRDADDLWEGRLSAVFKHGKKPTQAA